MQDEGLGAKKESEDDDDDGFFGIDKPSKKLRKTSSIEKPEGGADKKDDREMNEERGAPAKEESKI